MTRFDDKYWENEHTPNYSELLLETPEGFETIAIRNYSTLEIAFDYIESRDDETVREFAEWYDLEIEEFALPF